MKLDIEDMVRDSIKDYVYENLEGSFIDYRDVIDDVYCNHLEIEVFTGFTFCVDLEIRASFEIDDEDLEMRNIYDVEIVGFKALFLDVKKVQQNVA